MTYNALATEAVNYFPCQYGASKLLFRGPRRKLRGDFVAFLGGTETYGKFIEAPFPMLLEYETGLKSVNLGCANVGSCQKPQTGLTDRLPPPHFPTQRNRRPLRRALAQQAANRDAVSGTLPNGACRRPIRFRAGRSRRMC